MEKTRHFTLSWSRELFFRAVENNVLDKGHKIINFYLPVNFVIRKENFVASTKTRELNLVNLNRYGCLRNWSTNFTVRNVPSVHFKTQQTGVNSCEDVFNYTTFKNSDTTSQKTYNSPITKSTPFWEWHKTNEQILWVKQGVVWRQTHRIGFLYIEVKNVHSIAKLSNALTKRDNDKSYTQFKHSAHCTDTCCCHQ
jgi:hypothetical protein